MMERPGGRILNVGCGIGDFFLAVPQAELHGVDISERSLAAARLRFPTACLELASAYALPFKDDSFDTVVMIDVLEHLAEPGQCLQEIRRVLKPGGEFLLHYPTNPTGVPTQAEVSNYGHVHAFRPKELLAVVSAVMPVEEWSIMGLAYNRFWVGKARGKSLCHWLHCATSPRNYGYYTLRLFGLLKSKPDHCTFYERRWYRWIFAGVLQALLLRADLVLGAVAKRHGLSDPANVNLRAVKR
jgi:SAM-dependent methyltransferase